MRRAQQRWHGRPDEVACLVLMLLVAAALCLVGALRPATEASPAGLNAVSCGIALATAAALWWLPRRPWLLHTAGAVFLVGTTALVSAAATGEGALSAGLSYVWLSMYAAAFHPRWIARTYAAASITALAVALTVNPAIVSGLAAWLVVAVTLVVAVEVLSVVLERMRSLALTDGLTGVHNRAALEAALHREQWAAQRSGAPLALALLDLDGFKRLNDREGHAAGDRLLIGLTDEWQAGLRPYDRIFRYGGDEFVLLLPHTTLEEAERVVERLHRSSSAAWSYGVTAVTATDHVDDAVGRADRRMYAHKRRGPAAAI